MSEVIAFFQSNHESALIDAIHAFADASTEGFIVNFGAYSHTSIALHDALKSVSRPAIEVHISDIQEARKIRRHSMTGGACIGMNSGRGFPRYVVGAASAGRFLRMGQYLVPCNLSEDESLLPALIGRALSLPRRSTTMQHCIQ
jgi:3-dehydroquinate dehydratase